MVVRCIVDDDDVVIAVILHGDGFDVLEVSFSLSVVECRHNDAKGKLLVLIYVILRLVILPLFF